MKACHTGHILSGKSYKAEGLVTLSSLFYDMNSGSVSCTLTGQKHLFRCFSIFFMPARMLAIARNHDKGTWPVSSESIHVKLNSLNLTYVLDWLVGWESKWWHFKKGILRKQKVSHRDDLVFGEAGGSPIKDRYFAFISCSLHSNQFYNLAFLKFFNVT